MNWTVINLINEGKVYEYYYKNGIYLVKDIDLKDEEIEVLFTKLFEGWYSSN